ncbi:MAG: nucleoside-triphosphatase [Bacillota bacterium]|nr:nucleoside-triphosphatase [Bacillota bacterium]
MTNIFLTGPINVGKSTIINSVAAKLRSHNVPVSGFRTLPYIRNGKVAGYYIEPVNCISNIPDISKRLIVLVTENEWKPMVDTFEGFALEILYICLETSSGVIIMDELGFFEASASKFQRGVMQLLDSGRQVLGVIKPISIPFLDRIREKENVRVFVVSKSNRSYLDEEVLKLMNAEMGLWDLYGHSEISSGS